MTNLINGFITCECESELENSNLDVKTNYVHLGLVKLLFLLFFLLYE